MRLHIEQAVGAALPPGLGPATLLRLRGWSVRTRPTHAPRRYIYIYISELEGAHRAKGAQLRGG